jgi:hypothetical protein
MMRAGWRADARSLQEESMPTPTSNARRLAALGCAALVGLLSGCSTPYQSPVMVHGGARFDGVVQAMAAAAAQPVEVVWVHGMCTPQPDWAEARIASLVQAIDGNAAPPPPLSPPRAEAAALQAAGDGPPQVAITSRSLQLAAGSLHVSALNWSPLTLPLKRQLSFDATGTPSDCSNGAECKPQRARLNGMLKDGLLNDCLADVLVTQGVNRGFVRQQMAAALTEVVEASQARARAAGTAAPALFLVTESLGSKLAFDALTLMLQGGAGDRGLLAGRQAMLQLAQVFMAANQLPILSLAEQLLVDGPQHSALPSTTAAPAATGGDPLALLLQLRALPSQAAWVAQSTAALPLLALVAFTDPNDLLSYRLLASRYARPGVAITDVLVSNAPTVLGLLENPDTAHRGYLANRDVAGLIACGWPRSARCR